MEQKDYWGAIRSSLIGMGAGIAVLTLGALIAVKAAHPEGVIRIMAYTALAVGALVCGVLQGREGASIGFLCLAAGLYGLLPLTISLAIGGVHRFWIRMAVYLLMALIAALVGWLVPAARPKRKYRYK